jgi:hypothetical protein
LREKMKKEKKPKKEKKVDLLKDFKKINKKPVDVSKKNPR